MATKVQSKTYFPGSILDLNNGFHNSMWDPYHDERSSVSEKNHYNSFMMMQAMDGYSGYAKEQMRQTILKQDSIFRHQLEELHRLYKRQRHLMSEVTIKNHNKIQRQVIDLELPADVDEDNEGEKPVKRGYNLADLNEPIQMEEVVPHWYLSTNSQQREMESKKPVDQLPRKRTIFGVELCEKSQTPNDSSPNLEKKLPPWLMGKSNLSNDQTKGNETSIYQMNMDSLQNHSHQFFKKADVAKPNFETKGITKILGVPIVDMVNKSTDSVKENGESKLRHQIDLNLSFEEEDCPMSTPYIPEALVKIASMEIDLEADPPLTNFDSNPDNENLEKVAADVIMSMSMSSSDTLLHWFADVIESHSKKDSKDVENDDNFIISKGMDYFEYMTLKIQETKEECQIYKQIEEDEGVIQKRTTKRGQGKRGRQRKDFQRDILPGIISLSRREVTEDIQTFEEAFSGIGVTWQSKRKVTGKSARGRRRSAASDSPPPPEVAAESVCMEEKGLSGWGKRTRRLPRQRCQSGGSHQSLALKC